ncbi:hypothetical protein A2U01_0119451, partial [Trifolium medium]|nr:hypothetical protein [Trifolium medium]
MQQKLTGKKPSTARNKTRGRREPQPTRRNSGEGTPTKNAIAEAPKT